MLNYFIIFSFIGGILSRNSVYIYQSPRTSKVSITCSISGLGADKFSPNLHCPITESSLCYTNCTSECKFSKGRCTVLPGLEAIYACKYIFNSPDYIQIQYFIDLWNLPDKDGEWYCSYAGVNSQAITLQKANKEEMITKETVTERPKRESIPKKKALEDLVRVSTTSAAIASVTLPPSNLQFTELAKYSDYEISFKAFITKFQVVMGILGLFIISVILNIIFCIRDTLIKYYIENVNNSRPSDRCLLCCICQRDPVSTSATAKLDRVLSKEVRNSKAVYSTSDNNIYEVDSNRLLIPNTHNSYNQISQPSQLGRSHSLHYGSGSVHTRPHDHQYVTLAPGYSQPFYSPYYSGIYANGPLEPNASSSLGGSETPQEATTSGSPYQANSQGNSLSVRMGSLSALINPQKIDLLNEYDQEKISQSVLNLSKDG